MFSKSWKKHTVHIEIRQCCKQTFLSLRVYSQCQVYNCSHNSWFYVRLFTVFHIWEIRVEEWEHFLSSMRLWGPQCKQFQSPLHWTNNPVSFKLSSHFPKKSLSLSQLKWVLSKDFLHILCLGIVLITKLWITSVNGLIILNKFYSSSLSPIIFFR